MSNSDIQIHIDTNQFSCCDDVTMDIELDTQTRTFNRVDLQSQETDGCESSGKPIKLNLMYPAS